MRGSTIAERRLERETLDELRDDMERAVVERDRYRVVLRAIARGSMTIAAARRCAAEVLAGYEDPE